ncbi:hypothetical protein [Streptomyces sp. NPDC059533]|uniref:hypothetical protein n=1 Tax=unclassified Streptomyces TaxID=2593676 RepID=UPI0036BEA29B
MARRGQGLSTRPASDPVPTAFSLDNSWDAPGRPSALAIALLFGFSGTLFSRLALTATGQLVSGPGAPATGQQP